MAPRLYELVFQRERDPAAPEAFDFTPQAYLRVERDQPKGPAHLPWNDVLAALVQLRQRAGAALEGTDPRRRIGAVLRTFLQDVAWPLPEAALVRPAAKDEGPAIITVRSSAAELYALPWELATLPASGRYLVDLPDVLVRYEWPGLPVAAEDVGEGPPRVVFAWSSAGGAVPAAEHRRHIRDAVARTRVPSVVVDEVAEVSGTALEAALAKSGGPTVLHILCHGALHGPREARHAALLWNEAPGSSAVDALDVDRLRGLLDRHRAGLRLVVLSACLGGDRDPAGVYVGSLAQAVHRLGVPAVVASRYPLSVPGSIRLTRVLYEALLAEGAPIEAALLRARSALLAEDHGGDGYGNCAADAYALQLYGRSEEEVRDVEGKAATRAVTATWPLARPGGALGTPNNLPAPRLFVGRDKELAALERALGGDGRAAQASVYGLAGVGKTALALEYAHQNLGRYPGGVRWLMAEGQPTDALVRLAPILRAHGPASMKAQFPPERTAAAEVAEDVRVALQSHPAQTLLVLDNVSDPGWRDLLPGGAVHVLMTARDARWAVGSKVPLGVLSAEDARKLAVEIAGTPAGAAEAEALVRVVGGALGGLAVAVEMAARAVEGVFHSWMKYEAKLGTEMETLLEDPDWMGDYPRGVFKALDISIDMCPSGGAPRRMLEAAATFAPDAVPLAWVHEVGELDPEETTTDKALAQLRKLGLVTVDEATETLSVHRLVHRRVRARAKAEHKDAWKVVLARGVACVATWIDGAVQLNQTRVQMEAVDAHREHIDQALAAAEAVGSESEWIRIADMLATHFHNRAWYDESLALFQQALTKAEKLTPPDLFRVADVLSDLATVHHAMGQFAVARPLLDRALAIDEAHRPDHPKVAIRLSNLATVHWALGQPAAARPLLDRALAIDEATYGPDDPSVAGCLSNLASVHLDLGQPAVARPLLERALAIDEATYGPDHPLVAVRLSNLAMVHKALGQPATARPLIERALSIDEATYGPDHPNVALRLSSLASVHLDLGEPATARTLLERAVAIAQAHLPPDHPDLANYRTGLTALGSPR
jgi:tetratricopeptide (TPR) repeat protein